MSDARYEVLGVGAPFVDDILHVSEDFLKMVPGEKGGMVPIDYATLQNILSSSDVKPIIAAGGSGGNTIRGLARLGHHCAQVGKIGEDAMGKIYLEQMQALNIDTSCLISSKTPTAQALCLITPDGERTMRSFLGAAQEMSAADLHFEMFSGVSLVHIEGYSLMNGSLPERAMQLAKQAGAKVSFDMGSFEVVDMYYTRIKKLLAEYVDIVFGNWLEMQTLTGYDDPEMICNELAHLCEAVVVLLGPKGCCVGNKAETKLCPALKVDVVDTTGAGDLFGSGFLHGYLAGHDLEECARYGVLTSAAVVQVRGVTISDQEWHKIIASMQGLN